jgi:predicted transcriptional regulator
MGKSNTIAGNMAKSKIPVFSIHPTWMMNILEKRKYFELRRRPPKLRVPTTSLLYETAPMCQLRAICSMGPTISGDKDEIWRIAGHKACLSEDQFFNYFDGQPIAHAIFITDVREIAPLSLELLRLEANFVPPQAWSYASDKVLRLAGVSS